MFLFEIASHDFLGDLARLLYLVCRVGPYIQLAVAEIVGRWCFTLRWSQPFTVDWVLRNTCKMCDFWCRCNEVVRSRLRTGVMIDGEQLEEVTECKYLGRLVTSSNDISKKIAQRITSGWRRFGEYSHFLKIERSLFAWREKSWIRSSYQLWPMEQRRWL